MSSQNSKTTSIRVLVVEDHLLNQKLLANLLKHIVDCVISLANDGQQAVDMWETGEFDAVLMDVQMPVLDGLSATRRIRQKEAGTSSHVPIIAVTAGLDRRACIDAGMDDYLAKPVRRELLQEMLERVVINRE